MPYFKYNNITLFYIAEGKGKPLVLISGLGSKNSWDFQIPFFKEKMMVIALHNRGTGKSSRPDYPYSMDMYVEDINKLLNHLEIKDKIYLCGISMGGMIVQHFTLKYPERVKALILCATSAYYEEGLNVIESQKLMEHSTYEQKFKVRIAALYSRPFRKRLKTEPKTYEIIRKAFIEDPTELKDYINQGAAIEDHDTRERLHEITQPTLILVGNEDRIILGLHHSELLHEKIPNSTLKIIDNTGHGFAVEQSKKVNEIIYEFIKQNS
jgi:3-oxoadipate enol-lactonase